MQARSQGEFKDHFSRHAQNYAQHRPGYPARMFAYLASLVAQHELAWDCGTGNGQAAIGLAPHFDHVIATDASEQQILNAFPHDRVTYRVARAEQSGLPSGAVDMVTAAQALHWFDIPAFYEEVRRVTKPGGVLAAWVYSICRVQAEVDEILDRFYFETVGPYWPKERKLVDDGLQSIPFPFEEIHMPRFNIRLRWTAHDMLAYLRTWSPVRIYIERHGEDPVDLIEEQLVSAWGDPATPKSVRWPLYFRVGRVRV